MMMKKHLIFIAGLLLLFILPGMAGVAGAGSVWIKGSGKTQRFVADGDREYFTELKVDGLPFNEGVQISSGSTVADISAKAMEKLSVGDHTVTFVYVDGTASAAFTVQSGIPPAGDAGHPVLWLILDCIGRHGTCSAGYTVTRRKEKAIKQALLFGKTKRSGERTGGKAEKTSPLFPAAVFGFLTGHSGIGLMIVFPGSFIR